MSDVQTTQDPKPETSVEETPPVEIEEEGGEIARMCNTRYRGEPMISSLDLDRPETRLKLFNAGSSKATPLGDMIGKPFRPVEYLAERVRMKQGDKNRMGCRLTIWDDHDNQYFTASESIVTAFDRMVTYFGKRLEGLDGKLMEVTASKTKAGNQWYNVSLVDPPTKSTKSK